MAKFVPFRKTRVYWFIFVCAYKKGYSRDEQVKQKYQDLVELGMLCMQSIRLGTTDIMQAAIVVKQQADALEAIRVANEIDNLPWWPEDE
jgi:hypothetical protein